jgi:hypothetical protein
VVGGYCFRVDEYIGHIEKSFSWSRCVESVYQHRPLEVPQIQRNYETVFDVLTSCKV